MKSDESLFNLIKRDPWDKSRSCEFSKMRMARYVYLC